MCHARLMARFAPVGPGGRPRRWVAGGARALGVVLAAVLAVGAAGCGGDGADSPPRAGAATDDGCPDWPDCASRGTDGPADGGADGPADGGPDAVGGSDQPPNYGDNRRWRERGELSAADAAAGAAAAERIRPELERLRANGDLAADEVRAALVGLGFPAGDIAVQEFAERTVLASPGPGAAFGVRVGDAGCVVGSVSPDGVRTEVTGAAAEFGCLEPFTH